MTDPGPRSPRRQPTRTRFALATAALVAAMGAMILTVVYFSMRYLPDYQLSKATLAAPVITAPIPAATLVPATTPSAGIVVTSSTDVLNTLLVFSACAFLGLTLVGAIASWFLVGRMLRPLRALSEAAEFARRGSLSHRIGTSGRKDEFEAVSREFDAMLDELERSFAASERFAANASHEIRTPLTTTKALLEVAAAEGEAVRVDRLVHRLAESNDRLIGITDTLLDLATMGRAAPESVPVRVEDIVASELAEVSDAIEARGLRVQVRLDEPILLGDPGLLRLLVGNLLRNAVVHNHPGGALTVTSVARANGGVAFVVENTGDPIRPESLARLSEPFYRIRGRVVVPGERSGHGLGLAIVAGVVDAHRGSLAFESLPSGGLRVTADFPGAPLLPPALLSVPLSSLRSA